MNSRIIRDLGRFYMLIKRNWKYAGSSVIHSTRELGLWTCLYNKGEGLHELIIEYGGQRESLVVSSPEEAVKKLNKLISDRARG